MAEYPWEFVTVGKKLTLESTSGNFFELNREQMDAVASNNIPNEEIANYVEKEKDVHDKIKKAVELDGKTSRRIYVAWEENDPTKNTHCMSLVQFFFRESGNVMNVYFRSSDVKKLPYDLGFFSRIGKQYGVTKMQVMIGSLHIYMEQK